MTHHFPEDPTSEMLTIHRQFPHSAKHHRLSTPIPTKSIWKFNSPMTPSIETASQSMLILMNGTFRIWKDQNQSKIPSAIMSNALTKRGVRQQGLINAE